MATMQAVRFMGEGRIVLGEEPVPHLSGPDDVLIEVEAAGICGTDLQVLKVPPGHPINDGVVLGHEYAGRVVDVGPGVRMVKPGDRVVVDANLTCGLCSYCRNGMSHKCAEMATMGIHVDGGLAGYSVAPERALHKVPEDLSAEQAALVEPLACVVHGVDRLGPRPGDSAVVLGAGPIGQMFAQLLRAAGVRPVIVSEPTPFRRNWAADKDARVVDPVGGGLEQVVREETGTGADLVVDAVGTLLEQGLAVVRPGGTVLIFGQNKTHTSTITPYDLSHRELNILGSYIAPFCFPRAIELLSRGVVRAESLVSHRFGLGQVNDALELLRGGEAIKIIIDPRRERLEQT